MGNGVIIHSSPVSSRGRGKTTAAGDGRAAASRHRGISKDEIVSGRPKRDASGSFPPRRLLCIIAGALAPEVFVSSSVTDMSGARNGARASPRLHGFRGSDVHTRGHETREAGRKAHASHVLPDSASGNCGKASRGARKGFRVRARDHHGFGGQRDKVRIDSVENIPRPRCRRKNPGFPRPVRGPSAFEVFQQHQKTRQKARRSQKPDLQGQTAEKNHRDPQEQVRRSPRLPKTRP